MLDKLQYIIALAREAHFGRAAETCGVTQPTLSAGVKQLEEQMGVLEWARRIVGDTRSMREEINSLRHGLSGRLRIAAIPTALVMVATITTPYRERHPHRRAGGGADHRPGGAGARADHADRRRAGVGGQARGAAAVGVTVAMRYGNFSAARSADKYLSGSELHSAGPGRALCGRVRARGHVQCRDRLAGV